MTEKEAAALDKQIDLLTPKVHKAKKEYDAYEAHIYTEREVEAFFRSIDSCPESVYSPVRRYVIPVFFRLLFCCGLRSSEARLLSCKDVDLTTGQIMIRESKGWKARIIYVSDDLLALLVEYDTLMQEKMPGRAIWRLVELL